MTLNNEAFDYWRFTYPIDAWPIDGHNEIQGAVATCQGRRTSNEDCHNVRLQSGHDEWSYLGLFDGHAGIEAAQFLRDYLFDSLSKLSLTGDKRTDELGICKAFVELDDQFLAGCQREKEICKAGSTAVVTLVKKCQEKWKIICANVGDSRSILIRSRDGTGQVLTVDHHPNIPAEHERIVAAGGTVSKDWVGNSRVNGFLAVSRAFGDLDYKVPDKLVIAEPEIVTVTAETGDYLLLACDGLFEPKSMTSKFVVDFLLTELNEKPCSPAIIEQAIKKVVDQAIKSGSQDNITTILVKLGNATSEDSKSDSEKSSDSKCKPATSPTSHTTTTTANTSTKNTPPSSPDKGETIATTTTSTTDSISFTNTTSPTTPSTNGSISESTDTNMQDIESKKRAREAAKTPPKKRIRLDKANNTDDDGNKKDD